MFKRISGFLLAIFFSTEIMANPTLFTPDFSGTPLPISAGTTLLPLCNSFMGPLCIDQWSQQAVLMAVDPGISGEIPSFQYFLPAFIPSGTVNENLIGDDDWELWSPSSFSKRKRRERKSREKKDERDDMVFTPQWVFYRNKSNPNEIRVVETNEEGKQIIRAKSGKLTSMENIDKYTTVIDENPIGNKDWEVYQPDFQTESPTPTQAVYRNKANPDEIIIMSTDETGRQTSHTGTVNFIPEKDIKTTLETDAKKDVQSTKQTKDEDDIKEQSQSHSYTTAKATQAFSATTREVQPGCFIIDKPTETEAGFCFDCVRGQSEDEPVLSSLVENKSLWSGIKQWMSKVVLGSKKKVTAQTVSSTDSTSKICSPEISLKAIIKNFNQTCPPPYKNNFENFFTEAYCKSCRRGVPSEIMFAMMSIESAGRCAATAKNSNENSAGLFQVNAQVHQCSDSNGQTYTKNTPANLQCLVDPINNLNKGIDILFDHYQQVNAQVIDSSQCKSWLNMTEPERDSWRRGVSAYNGGPGWVTRAIKSVRNKQTLEDTSYLVGAHKQRNSEYKNDDASWEKLRVYYFIEKFSQGVSEDSQCGSKGGEKGTGRKLNCTISNLAHTEAVLGRNVKSSVPAMVDIWSQYKQKFLKDNKVTCPDKK